MALWVDGEVTQRLKIAPNAHSQLLLGMVEAVLKSCRLSLAQLSAVAVDVGPGSFTGLRIGIGVAQGLAYARQLPVIPITSLETLAQAQCAEPDRSAARVVPAIDARMGQVYYAVYENADGVPREVVPPALATPVAVGEALGAGGDVPSMLGVGNAWDRLGPQFGTVRGLQIRPNCHPEAASVARIAAGKSDPISPLELRAAYIRDQVAKPAGE